MGNKGIFRCRFKGCGKLYKRNAALKRHCRTHRAARTLTDRNRAFAMKLQSEHDVQITSIKSRRRSNFEEQQAGSKSEQQESDRAGQDASDKSGINRPMLQNSVPLFVSEGPAPFNNTYPYPDFFYTRVLPPPINVMVNTVPPSFVWMQVQAVPLAVTRRSDIHFNAYLFPSLY